MRLYGLRTIRLEQMLTQQDLAARSGLTKLAISKLERGITEARIGTVRKLTAALGVTLAELRGEAATERQTAA